MNDISGGDDDEVARSELARVKVGGLLLIKRGDGFFSAFDGSSQRMIGKVSGVKEFAQKFVGRVFDHLHLFDDDLLLAL